MAKEKFDNSLFLIGCYTTLHPALSVRPSIRRSVRHTLLFWGFCGLWPYCSCPNDGVTSNTVPADPHVSGFVLVVCYATLHPAMSARRSVGRLFLFLGSGPKGVDDLCFHTGEFSPPPPPPVPLPRCYGLVGWLVGWLVYFLVVGDFDAR